MPHTPTLCKCGNEPQPPRRKYCSDGCRRRWSGGEIRSPEAQARRLERKREYRRRERDRVVEYQRQYRLRRPHMERVRVANDRARAAGAIGILNEADVAAVFEAANGLCVCGTEAQHIDHIRGLADGGLNLPSNLQALCARCHGTKTAVEVKARVTADAR